MISVAFYRKCNFNAQLSILFLYRGQDVVEKKIKWVTKLAWSTASTPETYPCEPYPQKNNNASIPPPPTSAINIKARDHCHVTECFRGGTHMNCSLNFQTKVIMSLSGYDLHLFIK